MHTYQATLHFVCATMIYHGATKVFVTIIPTDSQHKAAGEGGAELLGDEEPQDVQEHLAVLWRAIPALDAGRGDSPSVPPPAGDLSL